MLFSPYGMLSSFSHPHFPGHIYIDILFCPSISISTHTLHFFSPAFTAIIHLFVYFFSMTGQLVREWTVFLNAWVCWVIKQKFLFSWKISSKCCIKQGTEFATGSCGQDHEAVFLLAQGKGILIRPLGYGLHFKQSPFSLMQNSHSTNQASSFKGH